MNLPAIASERGIDAATWSALQNSVFPGANTESIVLAVDYCNARKLDVMKKPCHIVPMKVGDSWRDVIMPGIYEQRTTAVRTGQLAGMDEPVFGESITYLGVEAPAWCRFTVYRFINGQRCPFTHTEYFVEACATTKSKYNDGKERLNAMWTKRPRGQLAKCAEAGALRKAFPDELGGVMTADEVQGEGDLMTAKPHSPPVAEVLASDTQIAELRDLLARTGKEEGKMLAFVGAARMEDMAAKKADELIATLRKHAPAAEPSAPAEPAAPAVEIPEPGEDIPL